MKNELWHAVSAGLLKAWKDELLAITNQDARSVLEMKSVWPAWLLEKSYSAVGNVISDGTLGELYDEIPDRIYDTTIRDQVTTGKPPLVENASISGGNTLLCDSPGSSYTTYVFEWDSGLREFTEIGPLSINSQPGSGYYVLSNTFTENTDEFGLPSAFLQLTS